jgi:hypothetical protein
MWGQGMCVWPARMQQNDGCSLMQGQAEQKHRQPASSRWPTRVPHTTPHWRPPHMRQSQDNRKAMGATVAPARLGSQQAEG